MPATTVQLSEEALSRIVSAIKGDPEAVNKIAGAAKPPDQPPLNSVVQQQIDEIFNDHNLQKLQTLFDEGKIKLPTRRRQPKAKAPTDDDADMGQDLEGADDADMEQNPVRGAVNSLDRIGGRNMPLALGSVLVGGALGVVATEVIDGFSPPGASTATINFTNLALKIGSAWGIATFTPMYIGSTGATIASAIIVFDAIRNVTPVDQWIQQLVNWIRGLGGTPTAWRGGYYQEDDYPAYQDSSSWNGGGSYQGAQLLPGHGGQGHDALANVFN